MRPSAATAALLVCFLSGVRGAPEPTTEVPLNCPEPNCPSKDCKTKIGSDGCLACDCETDCPTLVCAPGCYLDASASVGHCPECICNDGHDPHYGIIVNGKRQCPELNCPADCEKEKDEPPHRCPWCLCHAIAARQTLEKYGERHCPRPLMELLFRQADPLFHHLHALKEQILHQDSIIKTLDEANKKKGIGADANAVGQKKDCTAPDCVDKDCKLVPGDDGCPQCSCETVTSSKKKDGKVKVTGKARNLHKRHHAQDTKNDSSEENSSEEKDRPVHKRDTSDPRKDDSSEENSSEEKTHRVQKRDHHKTHSKDNAEKDHESENKDEKEEKEKKETDQGRKGRPQQKGQRKKGNNVDAKSHQTSKPEHDPATTGPVEVPCVAPACEPYCKHRQVEHGCLVCECPDVCPEMVCGTGCYPYFTNQSKCERCVCHPNARRDQMADVFASQCSDHTLHRMLVDFDAHERFLHELLRESLEQQQFITRTELALGIHGPVSEELKAKYGRHHGSHHHEHHAKHGEHHNRYVSHHPH